MALVDTSVWVSHLREGNSNLEKLLNDGEVLCHPFIVGELACGNLKNRTEILSLLQSLPMSIEAEHEEVLQFVENHQLMGKGLGYIDVHLIASAVLTGVLIWTLDRKLDEVSTKLGLGFKYSSETRGRRL
jgi:predicted nucleic acid-binding protein